MHQSDMLATMKMIAITVLDFFIISAYNKSGMLSEIFTRPRHVGFPSFLQVLISSIIIDNILQIEVINS
jgi:Na+/glutamate symporter